MKKIFSCSLNGATWWKPFLFYIVISVFFTTLTQKAAELQVVTTLPQDSLSILLFIIVLALIFSCIRAALLVLLARKALPAISLKEKPLAFLASVGEFVSLNLVCACLTIVTLGFYLPWYYARVNRYFFSHIEYEGERASFHGNPKKLIKPIILGLVLPFLLWALLFSFFFILAEIYRTKNYLDIAATFYLISSLVYLSIVFIVIPYSYYAFKWTINIGWKDIHITWKGRFWKFCFFVAGRLCLVILTLGIYTPAFILSVWQFLVERISIERDDKPVVRLEFVYERGTAFRYLWSQILLSLVTFGVYLPWAYANCLRFFIEQTFYDDVQRVLPDKQ